MLRLTSFAPELTQVAWARLIANPPDEVTLVGKPLSLRAAYWKRSQHDWAGNDTFETFFQGYWETEMSSSRISMYFSSPTTFKSQGVLTPLPLPRLVFASLERRWNLFAPQKTPADLMDFITSSIVIDHYTLRTQKVRFKKGDEWTVMPGFEGRCTFESLIKDQYWLRWVRLLAAFSLYAGVGKNTTMGLGQARLLDSRR